MTNIKDQDTLFLYSKVDDGCLSGNFWSVVWIAQFRSYVEAELLIVLHFTISKSHHWNTTYVHKQTAVIFPAKLASGKHNVQI